MPTPRSRLVSVAALATASAVVFMGAAVGLPSASMAADRTITLSAPKNAMAYVPASFSVRVTPKANAVVQIQMATSRGWVKVKQAVLNDRGSAQIAITSIQAGKRSYRASIISQSTGRVLGYSSRVTVTWAPLTHSVSLACSATSSPIRVRIPCTITVSPVIRLTGLGVQLQVKGMTDWFPMNFQPVPTDTGKVSATVEGLEPGLGMYRVRLLRSGVETAMSNTVSISWTAPSEAASSP